MSRPERGPLHLTDDLPLTQFGESHPGDGFRDRLRLPIGETEISLICGAVDETAASLLVTKLISPFAIRRTTTVGALRAEGFRVEHSPTRANRLHVSVYPPTLDSGDLAEWDDDLAKRFNGCFTEDMSGGEDGD